MSYYHYIIIDEEIKASAEKITVVPADFIEYEATLLGDSVYYKIVNGKITELIGEAIHEEAARRRVNEFLSEFLATPFEPL